MSLGSHFAKCADGKWYEDPLWFAPQRFFICLDEDEPPEIIVFDGSDPLKCLQEAGFTVKRLHRGKIMHRCPPWNSIGKLEKATAYFFRYKGMLPIPHLFETVSNEKPLREGTYFA